MKTDSICSEKGGVCRLLMATDKEGHTMWAPGSSELYNRIFGSSHRDMFTFIHISIGLHYTYTPKTVIDRQI